MDTKPALALNIVEEFVGKAHGNLDRVKEMLTQEAHSVTMTIIVLQRASSVLHVPRGKSYRRILYIHPRHTRSCNLRGHILRV